MHSKSRKSFAFLVLAYNHETYILEHLESIKYLVLTYGDDIDVDLIINDDNSSDRTQKIVDGWLLINQKMFRFVKTIYNSKNIGTCASVSNMLKHVATDRCKLTAADDVYSFENIFILTQCISDVAILSGRPLFLYGDTLDVDELSNFLMTATQVIYENDTLLHRFKHFSCNNAPNILYSKECLVNPKVLAHLQLFDVTEDWPLQIEIARQYPESRFQLINKVLVYYRRTAGSTYIIANKRFDKDKNKIYDGLIDFEESLVERARLIGRKYCFNIKNKVLGKILNFDFYFFGISCLLNLRKIYSLNKTVNYDVSRHQKHYTDIKDSVIKVKYLIDNQAARQT
jgi:hypothetical protein